MDFDQVTVNGVNSNYAFMTLILDKKEQSC